MNEIHIPIAAVHLETRFQRGKQMEYALLEPYGQVSPLRVRFSDLRQKLGDRFSEELPPVEIVARLARQPDLQLIVRLTIEPQQALRWELTVRIRTMGAVERTSPAMLSEQRRARRLSPERATDIKLEVGAATIEGTLYNVSEHGLGIALLTSDHEKASAFQVDQVVELVGEERIRGRIASQYPAAGGCVLGIELKERLDYARLYTLDA